MLIYSAKRERAYTHQNTYSRRVRLFEDVFSISAELIVTLPAVAAGVTLHCEQAYV